MKVLALSAVILALMAFAYSVGNGSTEKSPGLSPESAAGRAAIFREAVGVDPASATKATRILVPSEEGEVSQPCGLDHAGIEAEIDSLTKEVGELRAENNRLLQLSVGSLRPYLSEDELSSLDAEGVEAGIQFIEALEGDVSPDQVREYVPKAVIHQGKWRDLVSQRRRLPGAIEEGLDAEWSEERWAVEKLIVEEEDAWIASLREILHDDELLNKLGVYPPDGF